MIKKVRDTIHNMEMITICKNWDSPLPWMSHNTASLSHSVSFGVRHCGVSSSAGSDVSFAVDGKICPVGVHVAAGGAHSRNAYGESAPAVPTAK